MEAIRLPAVAGAFYPADVAQLQRTVDDLLAQAEQQSAPLGSQPKAIVAPHAGYVFSGLTAAQAYVVIKPWRETIKRVVLLGPTHRVAVEGVALPSVASFRTPLGDIPLDQAGLAALRDFPLALAGRDDVHAQEHSLEVHLPFLQRVLGDFVLLPLAVGNIRADQLEQILQQIWGGPETLIVVSTDLSHFQPYEGAETLDRGTCQMLLDRLFLGSGQQACGMFPLNGLTLAAVRKRLVPQLLGRCNSGDTAGDRERVVGYASLAYTPMPPLDLGAILLMLARQTLTQHFGMPGPTVVFQVPEIEQPGATFITLTQKGQLRGCIGSLFAHRKLGDDVRENALASALRDTRFRPLTSEELVDTRVEVSLLSPPERIAFTSQEDALARLKPGVDGVIFASAGRSSTFLPQVWEQLPDPLTFMSHLKQKAGFSGDYWAADVQLQRYHVNKWKEAPRLAEVAP